MTITWTKNLPVLAAALTNAELDEAIAEAYDARETAWAAQLQVTVANGFSQGQTHFTDKQALQAEAHYRGLCAEREHRDAVRAALGELIGDIRAYPLKWSNAGPWTYGLSGATRMHRADRLVDFFRNHNMPYKLAFDNGEVQVTFWRNHISSLAALTSARAITPNLPRKSPANLFGEGGYAADVQTQRLALQGA